jgi:hypothetical protein
MTVIESVQPTDQAPGGAPAPGAHRFDRLTADEARRAIYVDFEGRIDVEPVLLGVLVPLRRGQTVLHQYVWDPELVMGGGGLELMPSLSDAVEAVVRRADSRRRPIVAWSPRELEVVEAYCDAGLANRFRDRYVNANLIAKPWRRTRYPNLVWEPDHRGRVNSLSRYLDLIGHTVPEGCGEAIAAQAIQRVQDGLGRVGSFEGLKPDVKAAWANMLCHNRHDCIGMRDVCLRATADLERR